MGTDYEKYAIENKFIYETVDYIEKKDKTFFYNFTLVIGEMWYGVYRSPKKGLICISLDVDRKRLPVYNLTKENGQLNTLIVKSRHVYSLINDLVQQLEYGNVRFENPTVKEGVLPYLIKMI